MHSLTSLEEANQVTAVRLCEKRQKSLPGDLFRLSPVPGVFAWGRHIKTTKFFGTDFDSSLVYIYDAVGPERPSREHLRPSNLLLGPAVVNHLGWSRGYWEIICSEPISKPDVLRRHLFVRYRGTGAKDYEIVDENGRKVQRGNFLRPIDPRSLMHAGFFELQPYRLACARNSRRTRSYIQVLAQA